MIEADLGIPAAAAWHRIGDTVDLAAVADQELRIVGKAGSAGDRSAGTVDSARRTAGTAAAGSQE